MSDSQSSKAAQSCGLDHATSAGSPAPGARVSPAEFISPVEVIPAQRRLGLVLTCEHASNSLWDLETGRERAWPEADQHLRDDHWAWDPGAGELTRELAQRLGAGAVLARFSRLQCDANRDDWEPTLMRADCDGHTVHLNAALTPAERSARLAALWAPYHAAAEAMVRAQRPRLVLSLHSFTPLYVGIRRAVQVGVLHHSDESHFPAAFFEAFSAYQGPEAPLDVRYNQPWPGEIMYGPDRCAAVAAAVPIELEFRNDLLVQPGFRARAADAIVDALTREGLLGP